MSENIPFLYTLVENYFKNVHTLKCNKATNTVYRPQVVPKVVVNNLIAKCSNDPDVLPKQQMLPQDKSRKTFRFVARFVLHTLRYRKILLNKDRKTIKSSAKFCSSLENVEKKYLEMKPECENRSVELKSDKVKY